MSVQIYRPKPVQIALALLLVCWIVSPQFLNPFFGALSVAALSGFLGHKCGRKSLALSVLIVGIAAVFIINSVRPETPFWPYLAVVCANLAVAYVFGNQILLGGTTVLVQIVIKGHKGPTLAPTFERYLRRQCVVWVVFASLMIGISFVAMFGLAGSDMAAEVLSFLVMVQLIWFVVSHKIAQHTYGRPETWQSTLALLLDRTLFSRLDI